MEQPLYKLRVPDDVAVLIRRMHPDLKKKIKASMQGILSAPYSGKPLKDELTGLRSLRVSSFRIVYRILDEKLIEIVAIGPRERIYEETFRIISKGKGKPTQHPLIGRGVASFILTLSRL